METYMAEQSAAERVGEFVKLTVRPINGKPYYSIVYIKDGCEYEGYSSYNLDVISDYLRQYFATSINWRHCHKV